MFGRMADSKEKPVALPLTLPLMLPFRERQAAGDPDRRAITGQSKAYEARLAVGVF
jgi:hypothetical protein